MDLVYVMSFAAQEDEGKYTLQINRDENGERFPTPSISINNKPSPSAHHKGMDTMEQVPTGTTIEKSSTAQATKGR